MQKNFAGNHATVGYGLPYDPLLRDREAADMIGVSVSTFWRRVQDGTFPRPLKIGNASRWKQSWIQSGIEKAAENRGAA